MSSLPENSTYKKKNPGGGGYASGDADPPSELDRIAQTNPDTQPHKDMLAPSGSLEDPAVQDALADGRTIQGSGSVFRP